ncbi:3-oxoacyl-ACP synthase III family protein [Streptomyces sp. NPDC057638]|uniref:3-oxoacyl-ACP synthase III family protein n=1 Tax=Streptomyces sp. NPDC057638 TaxID=3346190 RepID=UPI0036B10A81
MPETTDRHVSVVATGAFLPGDPLDNDALARLVGPLPDELLAATGVRRRHWLVDPVSGEHRTGTARMATAAARQALDRAGMAAGEPDLIVVSTASPDDPLPVTGTYVQEALGLERCAVIEIRAGCVGAVQALDTARRLLADGTHRTALVIGAESISPLLTPLYLGRDPRTVRLRDRLTVHTFGDGAAAVVLRAGDEGSAAGRPRPVFATRCLGGARAPGMRIARDGTEMPPAGRRSPERPVGIRLDLPGTAAFGPRVFVTGLRDVLEHAGLSVADIDVCVVPEGDAAYFSDAFEAAGLSAAEHALLRTSLVENLADVGATGSPAVLLALDAGWVSGRVRPGDTVVLLAVEASRYLYAGLTLTWDAPAPVPGR